MNEPSLSSVGFDFSQIAPQALEDALSNALSSSPDSRKKKIKLTPAEQKELLLQFMEAVVAKDEPRVRSLVSQGMSLGGNVKVSGSVRLSSFLVSNFDKSLMDFLAAQGLSFPYADKLFKQAVMEGSLPAAQWLLNNPASKPSAYVMSDVVDIAVHRGRLDMVEAFATTQILNGLSGYRLANALNSCAAQENHLLAIKLLDERGNKKNDLSYFFHYYASKWSWKDCAFWQQVVKQSPGAESAFSASFPIQLSAQDWSVERSNSIKISCNNLFELCVAYGAPAVADALSVPAGRQKFQELISRAPAFLDGFLRRASNPTIHRAVGYILAPSSELVDWTDGSGNTVAHYLAKVAPSKVNYDVVYSVNKDMLLVDNHSGQSAASMAPENLQAYINNRLMRRVLNDNKIGLRHQAKSTKRRM